MNHYDCLINKPEFDKIIRVTIPMENVEALRAYAELHGLYLVSFEKIEE